MAKNIRIDGNSLTLEDVQTVAFSKAQVSLSKSTHKKLGALREKVEILAQQKRPIYGVNTGFGALSEKPISPNQLEKLQHNLIISHAVGVGEPLTVPQARAITLLRANTLAKGFSGVRPVLIEHLLQLLNSNCAPWIPSKGSVGASGDLAPLAHLALLLLGEGPAYIGSQLTTARKALQTAGLSALQLQAKEGLALINGTQAIGSLLSLGIIHAERLAFLSDLIGASSLFAINGHDAPFDSRIHQVRPHTGQQRSAERLRAFLSPLQRAEEKPRVQDAYSFRCMPQVHGASLNAIQHTRQIVETEINSATDNPLVFKNTNGSLSFLSGGNFHAQPLALAADYLCIALAELGNISERRIEQLVNPALSGLSPFLTPEPGINSGFMILHITAGALVNENKVLCTPASIDSIPTSAGREDHVSMGMTAANKLGQVIENVYHIFSIELMAAYQAMDLAKRLPNKGKLKETYQTVRQQIAFAPSDRLFQKDLQAALQLCKEALI